MNIFCYIDPDAFMKCILTVRIVFCLNALFKNEKLYVSKNIKHPYMSIAASTNTCNRLLS